MLLYNWVTRIVIPTWIYHSFSIKIFQVTRLERKGILINSLFFWEAKHFVLLWKKPKPSFIEYLCQFREAQGLFWIIIYFCVSEPRVVEDRALLWVRVSCKEAFRKAIHSMILRGQVLILRGIKKLQTQKIFIVFIY